MKKQFVIGMVLVSMLSVEAHAQRVSHAAASAAVRAKLVEYMKEAKPRIFGGGRVTSKGLAAQARDFATSKAVEELPLDTNAKSGLVHALTVSRKNTAEMVEANYESLVVIVGARQLAKQLIEKQPELAEEAGSMMKAADAALKAMSDSILIGSRPEVANFLSKAEVSEISTALRKEATIVEAIMKMERAERDSWTQIIEKRTELVRQKAMSPEEAYIRAIMEVKGVSREKALEILRKIKDCV